ncbi:hypothetical protein Arub01_57380 [Actinomadura rubrobrunea]|uniref:Uncharacterized protein n=1 Tax=Actinomadura rubrobrunea TaxID=115335 RepID=A0A9W6Q009_9ACTN|nr:hypothetical protein [Actinomadura rubrobrunea]GLW67495.1 hypothetical protein Arub01_57380 [Actinomadura rubrobrunea]
MATSADDTERTLPRRRRVGASAGPRVAPDGRPPDGDGRAARRGTPPPAEDGTPHMRPLMRADDRPGETARRAAPPRSGITGRPFAYEHVPLH